MKYGIHPKLTKDYILQYLTQEQIFERYLGIPVEFNTQLCNPLRRDKNPTCTFKWSGHKLRFKDWAGYFWGDCFDLVAFIYGLNPSQSEHFIEVLTIIAKDFRLGEYSSGIPSPVNRNYANHFITGKTVESKKVITIKKRNWNSEDAKYWTQYGIYKAALDYFNVYPCNAVWINDNLIYEYSYKDPAYAYYFGKDKDNIDNITVYYPNRDKYRFIMNHNKIAGLNRIKPAEILIITKSYKDIISLNCVSKPKFSIEVIAPPSETYTIPKDIFYSLWGDYNYIVSLMDFDFAGRNMAWKLKSLYNIPALFLTNGAVNTRNYGAKDFTEYVKNNGVEKALTLVEEAKIYITSKYKKYENRRAINNNT